MLTFLQLLNVSQETISNRYYTNIESFEKYSLQNFGYLTVDANPPIPITQGSIKFQPLLFKY